MDVAISWQHPTEPDIVVPVAIGLARLVEEQLFGEFLSPRLFQLVLAHSPRIFACTVSSTRATVSPGCMKVRVIVLSEGAVLRLIWVTCRVVLIFLCGGFEVSAASIACSAMSVSGGRGAVVSSIYCCRFS